MNTKMKKLYIIILLVLSHNYYAFGNLAAKVSSLVSDSSQKKVKYSVNIVTSSGQTLYSFNSHQALIPASNMKLITTAAAMKYLSPDFQYTTRIGLCGNTLAVIGSGDPLLGDSKTDSKFERQPGWIFLDIAKKLQDCNIASISDIIIDNSVFDDERVHPNWPKEQLNQWYACEIAGVNYNDNCIAIIATNDGGTISIATDPQTHFIVFTNNVKPISSGESAIGTFRQAGVPNNLTIYGKCKKTDGPFDVAIENPSAYFGTLLSEHLALCGIKNTGSIVVKPVDKTCEFKLLAEYKTPIAECLDRANKNSLGLVAEALLKTISAANSQDGKNGSWPHGGQIIGQYLKSIGIDSNEFNIDDGSGLSRQDKLSANAITTVLLEVYKSSYWETFKNSLAVGGVDGTINKYFYEKKYKGKIHAKTGYIAGVKSLSGVCCTSKGDYLFSIITNDANGKTRTVINDIAQAIIDEYDK